MTNREDLIALMPEHLRERVREQLRIGDANSTPPGHCVACRLPIDASRVWLLLNGGLEAHEECEAVATVLVPNPILQHPAAGIEVKPMRMHPPMYSTIELPTQKKTDSPPNVLSAPDVRKPWKR